LPRDVFLELPLSSLQCCTAFWRGMAQEQDVDSEIVMWSEVNKRMPLLQTPASREARKAMFVKLCPKGHKSLTHDDLQKGMKNEMRYDMAGSFVPGVTEMTKTITFAFKCASELGPNTAKAPKEKKQAEIARVNTGVTHQKGKAKGDKEKGSVDKREFHAFLMAFRYVLELAEWFELCDGGFDDDQKLSCREALKGVKKLASWGVSEEMLREKFSSVDVWIPLMKFSEFEEWIMEFRMAEMTLKLDDSDDEEVQFHAGRATLVQNVDLTFADLGAASELNQCKVKEAFQNWDKDGSGGISEEELATVMKELNPDFTDLKIKLLFDNADKNRDGMIDFNEFLAFVFQ